jgi:hypothetical protein
MAGFTANRSAVQASLLHLILELSSVRIHVASCTRELIPVVCNRFRLKSIAFFVAISAWNRHVAASQDELGRFVSYQRKRGRFIPLQVMAALTAVEVWRRSKLSRMLVGMAVGATLELDLELCVFAFRDVASGALHHGVSALQRIGGGSVILYSECRRLETVDGMAGSALAASRTLGKLTLVRVGLVTIRAPLKGKRLFEISARVALRTFHGRMFAQQRVLGC